MTDEELSELEECIDSYCRAAMNRGYRIQPGNTVLGKECCPMGAVLICKGKPHGLLQQAANALGLSRFDCVEFAYGFDGRGLFGSVRNPMYAMGTRFRERVLAGDYAR